MTSIFDDSWPPLDGTHCLLCGRATGGRVDSTWALEAWNRLRPTEVRKWLPVCDDNDGCPLRLGILMGFALRR